MGVGVPLPLVWRPGSDFSWIVTLDEPLDFSELLLAHVSDQFIWKLQLEACGGQALNWLPQGARQPRRLLPGSLRAGGKVDIAGGEEEKEAGEYPSAAGLLRLF